MNTNDLRAAAERLLEGGCCGNMAHPVDHDAMAVARGYLAEHPADDDERASPDWIERLGIKDSFNFQNEKCYKLYSGINVMFSARPWPERWQGFLWVGGKKGDNPTRGDVRRLAAALGLELKG